MKGTGDAMEAIKLKCPACNCTIIFDGLIKDPITGRIKNFRFDGCCGCNLCGWIGITDGKSFRPPQNDREREQRKQYAKRPRIVAIVNHIHRNMWG